MCFSRIDVLFNDSSVRQSNCHTLVVQADLIDVSIIVDIMRKLVRIRVIYDKTMKIRMKIRTADLDLIFVGQTESSLTKSPKFSAESIGALINTFNSISEIVNKTSQHSLA